MPTEQKFAPDKTLLLKRANGDTDQLKRWIELFLEEYATKMATIRQAVLERDCDTLAGAAHSLAGSIITFEAHKTVQAARHLEQMCRSGNPAQIEEALHAFLSDIAAVKRALSDLIRIL